MTEQRPLLEAVREFGHTQLGALPTPSEQIELCKQMMAAISELQAADPVPDDETARLLAEALALYRHSARRWITAVENEDSAARAAALRARRQAVAAFESVVSRWMLETDAQRARAGAAESASREATVRWAI